MGSTHVLGETESEQGHRDAVMARVCEYIREERTIRLPAFDPSISAPAPSALVTVGLEPNGFSGAAGPFRYQFEGEDDLLHLIVTRSDGAPLTPEEAQPVVAFLLPQVAHALIWLRPGVHSQHFYIGHEELLSRSESPPSPSL